MGFTYPIMLDLAGRSVVIVGGGAVAARKARALIEAGAVSVTVVSPTFDPAMPQDVRRIAARYEAAHLDSAGLVFAATDSREVNDAVVRDSNARRILVNRADTDDALPGDFSTPAQLRQGPITVTVSAGSAALTAAVRDGIADRWDDRWTAMAAAMQEIRPMVLEAGLSPPRRTEVLRLLASDAGFERLTAGGVNGVKEWIQQLIATEIDRG